METKEFRTYGPPGTGKTTWAVANAMKCADKYGADQVSLCSLTNTAVKEVAGRDLALPRGNVSTLHARCKRALMASDPAESHVKEFAKAYPKHSSTEGAFPCLPQALLRKSKSDTGEDLSEVLFAGSREVSMYEQAQILRQQLIPNSEWPSEVRDWFVVWSGWCRETGRMDFTGWLEAALDLRPLPPQQVIFVDEAQDHTPLQLAVLRSWRTKSLILIGDDDQNLYEWSGSVPSAFYGKELPPGQEFVLEQSYRVPRRVHTEALRWLKQMRQRKAKIYRPRDAEGEVTFENYSTGDAKYGDLPPGLLEREDWTYMLLTSCGYMLDDIISLLRSAGISFHNPYRKSNLRWNPLDTPKEKLRSFLPEDRLWTGVEAQDWLSVLKASEIFKKGKRETFSDRCDRLGTNCLTSADIEECFNDAIAARALQKDVRIFAQYRKVGVSGSWDYALAALKRDNADFWNPRVVVGTIHSVKGGEAEEVYLFPDISASGEYEYRYGNADQINRLFYVGVTRAREALRLCRQNRPFQAVEWLS